MPLSGISISLRASVAYKYSRHLDTISSLCDCSISTMNWGVGPGEMDDWKSETAQDSSHVQSKFCLPSSGFGRVFVCLLVLLFWGVWGFFCFAFCLFGFVFCLCGVGTLLSSLRDSWQGSVCGRRDVRGQM